MTLRGELRAGVRVELRLQGRDSLADDLAFFGRSVGPRTGPKRRTAAQREDYSLRRLLVALVALKRLELPVSVQAHEAAFGRDNRLPDFTFSWRGNERLGVEVTEAGSASWQQWLSKADKRSGAVFFPGEGGQNDGYEGDIAEQYVVHDVEQAIRRKAAKASQGRYAGVPACDLLLHVISEGGAMADRSIVLDGLQRLKRATLGSDIGCFRQVHMSFGDIVHVDLFGNSHAWIDVSREHAEDWVGWLASQSELLREGELAKLDATRLAMELESLGRSDQRALKHQLGRLLLHLLKWQFQPKRHSRSWRGSIDDARGEIAELLAESPSLMPVSPKR